MIDRLINRNQVAELIGMRLKAYRLDKSFNGDRTFGKVGFFIQNKKYVLENSNEYFENYFWGADEATVLSFREIDDEKGMRFDNDDNFLDINVSSIIDDILLVQDTVIVLENGDEKDIWKSTEGLIVITKERQYAFFKEDSFSELVSVYKGRDTLKYLENIKEHWDIFADELSCECTREILSVKSGQIFSI